MSSDVLLLLRLEHRNIVQLLSLLAAQRDRLADGRDVDLDLLETALAYFEAYPDACHHPKEDLIYRRLVSRSAAIDAGAARLEEDHADLGRETQALAQRVRDVHAAGLTDRAALLTALDGFLASYRHHLEMEETHFFTAAERALSDEDWDAIEFELFDRPDPVFDRDAEDRFSRLRAAIGGGQT